MPCNHLGSFISSQKTRPVEGHQQRIFRGRGLWTSHLYPFRKWHLRMCQEWRVLHKASFWMSVLIPRRQFILSSTIDSFISEYSSTEIVVLDGEVDVRSLNWLEFTKADCQGRPFESFAIWNILTNYINKLTSYFPPISSDDLNTCLQYTSISQWVWLHWSFSTPYHLAICLCQLW